MNKKTFKFLKRKKDKTKKRCGKPSRLLTFEYLGQPVEASFAAGYFHLDLPPNDKGIAYTVTNCQKRKCKTIQYKNAFKL